jgi:hypothetical protein
MDTPEKTIYIYWTRGGWPCNAKTGTIYCNDDLNALMQNGWTIRSSEEPTHVFTIAEIRSIY